MTTEEYFKKLLEDSEKHPTNWLSDRVLDKNIKMLDEDIEAEWDDFPLFTKKIFINTTQRDYNKADAVVKFLESIAIEMEYKKGLNIVIQALNELKDSLKNQVLGVIDNQILFPNDNEDTK
ncbi:TPA: hypothetical protein ACJVH5_001044 [Streptococcus agalactiae]